MKPKWNTEKNYFFDAFSANLQKNNDWNAVSIENNFKQLATDKKIKPGDLQLPLRVMLVGGKFGPPVFTIAEILGKEETIKRIKKATELFNQ